MTRPSRAEIARRLRRAAAQPFSYPHVGASRGRPPSDYTLDHTRVVLGQGQDLYARAAAAIRRWEPFNIPWLELCWPTTPPTPDLTIGILARAWGLWSLNASRVVYLIDEAGAHPRYGFAYGTLPLHAARGEERFTVELRPADNAVIYDILAFSRPNHPLAWLGYPFTRRLQRRFASASALAMRRATR